MARKQGNPPTEHTVEDGDKLFDIAQAYYGDDKGASQFFAKKAKISQDK